MRDRAGLPGGGTHTNGFFAALGLANEGVDGCDDDAVAGRLRRLGSRAERVVLVLDHYEVFRLLDTWLRQIVVPALPSNVRLAIAGREAPNAAWVRLPTGAFEGLALGPLARAESADLVRLLGVAEPIVHRIARFGGGHPLTLVLAALAVKEEPTLPVEDVTMGRLVDEFALAYLDDLDKETRHLLEAATVVRRVTRTLLSAMLPDADPSQALERLRRLPVVDAAADGLAPHESVQHAIAHAAAGDGSDVAPNAPAARVEAPACRAAPRPQTPAVALHRGHDLPAGEPRGPGGAFPQRWPSLRNRTSHAG